MSEHLRVLIAGAGIGGLCLAQGLRRAGIEVTVFERDRSQHFRNQGYRIGLNTDGGRALKNCLPGNLFDLCIATSCKPLAGRFVVYDGQLGERHARPMPQPINDLTHSNGPFTSVNRLTLREILLVGLEDAVHFGKSLTGVEQKGGEVRAQFADGTFDTGDLLVGADGANSFTRQWLLPHAKLSNPAPRIYGRTILPSDMDAWAPGVLTQGISIVRDAEGATLMMGAFRKSEVFGIATARLAPLVHLTEVPDYLMWTMNASHFALELDEKSFWAADGAELKTAAQRVVASWHPFVRQLIDEADAPAIFPVALRSSERVAPWPTTNVTILGDAIHTMSPARGLGANTALKDAELLCRNLTAISRREQLLDAVNTYESAMLVYGFEAVAESSARSFFGPPNSPMGGYRASSEDLRSQ
jgi:2-polyprenyl-6-methoxyphenol hydroxylase-like FAD-dependent oxidoreductase